MNATTKLAVYGGALIASFAIAAGIGGAVGPIDTGDDSVHHDADAGDVAHPTTDDTTDPSRPGTSLDAAGFRLVPDTSAVAAGETASYSFVIVDHAGRPVTMFDQLHERELHLVVASRDLVTFHHLHPERDDNGTWSIDLPSLSSGSYRVYADAAPNGADQVTLGHDLVVGDDATTGSPPPVVTTSVDGLDVTMIIATPDDGSKTYEFVVERDGETVTVEPYLGALGHLVALRVGDLAYIHVHAAEMSDATIGFGVEFPTPGAYRLFLDFSVDGTVHTADFTVEEPEREANDMNGDTSHDTSEQGH